MLQKQIIVVGVILAAVVAVIGWFGRYFYFTIGADEVVFPPAPEEKCLSETATSEASEYDAFARKNSGLFFVQPPASVYTGQRFTINVVFDKNFFISSSDATKKLLDLLREEWENPSYDVSKNPVTILRRVSGSATLYPLNPDYTESKVILSSDEKIENPVRLDQTSKIANQVFGNTSFDPSSARGVSYFMVGVSPSVAGRLNLDVILKDVDGVEHKVAKVCVEVKPRPGTQTAKEKPKEEPKAVPKGEGESVGSEAGSRKETPPKETSSGSASQPNVSVPEIPKCGEGKTFDEDYAISLWLKDNQDKLNQFGDPKETVYTGGSPLFNEKTGERVSLSDYVIKRHPERPWRDQKYCKGTPEEKPLEQSQRGASVSSSLPSSPSPSPVSSSKETAPQASVIKGDIDSDGKVTVSDRDLAVKMATNLITPTSTQIQAGDLDLDGKITLRDATLISKKLNPASSSIAKSPTAPSLIGDLNGDSKLDESDVQLLLDIAVSKVTPTAKQKELGDLNKDGKLTAVDATLLLQTINSINDTQAPGIGVKGDLNGDGKVTQEDLELAEKIVSGVVSPTPAQLKAADLNDDGRITSEDLSLIKNLIPKEVSGPSTGSTERVYLRPGLRHPEIKVVKQVLKNAGYYEGEIDDNFDEALSIALKNFQKARGLRPTGKLSSGTVKELNKMTPQGESIKSERKPLIRTVVEKIIKPVITPLLKLFGF